MHELGGEIVAAAKARRVPRPSNATGTGPAAALKNGNAGPVPDMMSATLDRATAKGR